MEAGTIAFLSGLAGALIGAAGSVATVVIQTRYRSKVDRARLAVEAAIEDHKRGHEVAQAGHADSVPPLCAMVFYHSKIVDLLAKDNLTKATLKEASDEYDEVSRLYER